MKNILIINQSAELYGSDKAILELILNFPADYNPIVVIQENGLFKDLLEEKGIQVIDSPVIKVKRGILTPFFFLKLPFQIFKSFRNIKKQLNGKKIDIVHSNSTSVFIGAFYSFFFRKKHLWHVHEIIEKPKFLAKLYPHIIYLFSDSIVYNSEASYQNFFKRKKSIKIKSIVIYNGQERNFPVLNENERLEVRKKHLKVDEKTVTIGLVGRISKWKGQMLLLEAFKELEKKYSNISNIHLVYVGSVSESQEYLLTDLIEKVKAYDLENKVTIIDFQKNIWQIYDALDIIVVPSTEPEPFGLVATEAMLSYKPVIAANHGGLTEIVVDNETGLFFKPRDTKDLQEKLSVLIESPELIENYGLDGNKRVKEFFSTEKYVAGFKSEYDKLSS